MSERRRVWRNAGTIAALAAVVGLVTGCAAIAFEYLSQLVFARTLGGPGGYRPVGPANEPELFAHGGGALSPWLILLFPTVGGLVSGWLCQRFAPEARGHGTDAAIEAYHEKKGFIRGRVPLLKAITTAITLGTGGSGGREGPIAQMGAGVGSVLGTRLGLRSRQRRILLAAGMGAGVGAIFRAPLAGAIFSAEILYRDAELESDVVLPSFISTTVAYVVFCSWFGSFDSLFAIPRAPAFDDARHLAAYSLLGLVLVLAIPLWVKTFYGFEALFARLRGPRFLVVGLGGLLTGATGLALWRMLDDERALAVMSSGYGVLQEGFLGEIDGWSGARLLLLVALGKILATSFTISSGGSGGVFGPSMVIGGGIGGAVGIAAQQLGLVEIGEVPVVPAFIVVGMCGFFAGAAKTPISTIIMVSEMTGSYHLLLPAMWVCAITFLGTGSVTLYRKQVRNRAFSRAHRDLFRIPLLQDMRVDEVLETERAFPVVAAGTPLGELVRTVASSHADYFPVVDDRGVFVGIFSAHDVRSFTYDDALHGLVVAADIMTTGPITVTPEDDLHVALERFSLKNIDELPVVDAADPGRLVGMLRRRALTRAYRQRLDQLRIDREEDR